MDIKGLVEFIKIGLRSKWNNLTEEELDLLISEIIFIEEICVGSIDDPFIRYAITNQELNNGKGEDIIKWGKTNLSDLTFWDDVAITIRDFELKNKSTILVLVLHFNNRNDAALFSLCWQ